MAHSWSNKSFFAVLFGLSLVVAVFAVGPNLMNAASLVSDFKQCANNESSGPVTGLGNCHWIGSIVQQSNARYFEGMSVPQRTLFTGIVATAGDSHSLTFSHQSTKSGIHAYDFLTSYNQAVSAASAAGITLTLNPCGVEIGPPGSLGATCATLRTQPVANTADVDVPDDAYVSKDGSTASRISAYEAVFGNRTIKLYGNSPITSASLILSHTVGAGADTGDSDVNYTLTWVSASDKILIEMAGHLALTGDGTGASWGAGLGSGQISGGPYHFNLSQLDGGSLGSQDNQIKGADILVPNNASITVIKDAVPNNAQDFSFTTTGGLTPASFSLDDDSDSTLQNSQVFSGLAPGTYSVAEGAVTGWSSNGGVCDDGSPVSAISLQASENIICTLTNTLQTGHIIVDKVTVPASDPQSFSFTTLGTGYSGFSLTDAATPDDQTLNADAYSVSETVPAGWSSDGGVCVSSIADTETPGALELDAGETITCTFTNTKLGKILVDKVTNPSGSGQSFEFDPSYPGANFFLTDAATVNDSGLLSPGTYSVSEVSVPTGWSLTSATCSDGSPVGAIALGAGETVTCTFTNTQNATIIVKKDIVGGTGTFSYTGTPSGSISTDLGTIQASVVPGQYASTETVPAGWSLDSIVCDDANSSGSVGSATATFNAEAGEIVTCTFTNTKQPTLTVNKVIVPSDDSGLFNLQIDGSTAGTGANVGNGGTTGAVVVSIGGHTVGETAGTGTTLSDYTSVIGGDCALDGTVSLAAGENKTCTITNTKKGHIIVNKVTDPSGDTQSFDFVADFGNFSLTDAAAPHDSGALVPGTYSVSETVPAGWDLTSATCDDGSLVSAIGLAAGETVTCTFNNQKDAFIIVDKVTDPAADQTEFDFTTDYGSPFVLADATTPNNSGDLAPGTYSVTEAAEAGWDPTSATCSDDSPINAIVLSAGETVTCTFTNTKRAHIIIQKNAIPDDSQVFAFNNDFGNGNPISFNLTDDTTPGLPSYDAEVIPGTYAVSETAVAGWESPESTSCSDGSPVSAIAVSPGETVTCTFTNEKLATIILVKNTVGGNGAFDFAMTGSGLPAGTQLTTIAGTDSETFNDLDPDNEYSIEETPIPAGWDLTSAVCSGTNTPASITPNAGETVTCTFTNMARGKIIVEKQTLPDGSGQSFDFTSNYDGDGFSLTDGLQNNSGFLVPGNYSVAETGEAGWDLTSATCNDDDSTNPASLTLDPGETITCVFENTQRGHLIVQKTTDPTGDQTVFNITASGTGSITGGGAGTVTDALDKDYEVTPGTYSVTEAPEAGWDEISNSCSGVVVDPGETETCLITNQQDAFIIVQKQTDPNGDPADFDFTASYDGDGFILSDGETNDSGDLAPGTYSVSENAESGWDLTGVTCTSSLGGSETNTAIDLTAGETVTCVFTNQKDANIVVQKQTDPDGDSQVFDFTASYDGDGFSLSDGQSNDSGDLDPGTYSVSEIVPAGWDLAGASCASSLGGSEDESAIALTAGETVTCTFENTKRGHITIEKQTLPDGSAADFTFTGNVLGTLSDGENATQEVAPGIYTSTETVPSGWDLTSIVCNDTDSSGIIGTGVATFNVAPGEDVTCVFTNTQRGHIIVDKVTNPSADPQSFTFTTTGAGYAGFLLTDADTPNDQEVMPGGYSVAEGALANWDSDGGICDNGETPASLDVEPGETVTCTITNTKKATLTIVKDADPNDAQDFVFTRSFGANFTLDDDAGVQDAPDPNQWQNSQTFSVSAGSHTVAETIPSQYWKLDSVTCVNTVGGTAYPVSPATNGVTIDLTPGADVTCTFQNDKITPTRTQGFWQTHYTYTSSIFNNPPNVLNGFSANLMLIGDGGPHKGPVNSTGKIFGAFWSNIAKKTTGQQRTALEKARMQLLQQLVAAKLNCAAFGCTAGVQTMIVSADTAFAGSNTAAILTAAGQMDVYNNSGDTIIIGNAGKADPKTAKSGADYVFWNTP